MWASKELKQGDAAEVLDTALSEANDNLKPFVGKLRLNLANEGDEADDEAGDVLLFPQMRRHRLGPPGPGFYDASAEFARDGISSASPSADNLWGSHVFVCTHGTRDARCGTCGPALIAAFRASRRELGRDFLDVVNSL